MDFTDALSGGFSDFGGNQRKAFQHRLVVPAHALDPGVMPVAYRIEINHVRY
jgi:hypothetical protein